MYDNKRHEDNRLQADLLVEGSSKFDRNRANEYDVQCRIALAGYDACHELSACIISAVLKQQQAHVLVVGGGGTGMEVKAMHSLRPDWRFTVCDPSEPMLTAAKVAVECIGLSDRVAFFPGPLAHLSSNQRFDAATLIGVLHHLPLREEKISLLQEIAGRLEAESPFVLACNHLAYTAEPIRVEAWRNRWLMAGSTEEEADAALKRILAGAVPPHSEEEVFELLAETGFHAPTRFFSSLFWGAWMARRLSSKQMHDCHY